MTLFSTRLGYRALTLAAALALPGLAQAQQAAPAASLAAFGAKAKAQGLKASDVADVLVTNSYTDASTGITHTYLQQRVNGLVVFNATGAVHTDKAGKVVFAAQDFVANANARAAAPQPALTPAQAVVAASVSLGLPRPVGLRTVVEARAADGMKFNNGGISEEDIPVRLMYTRQRDQLVLVWEVTIAQLDQQHHWSARIDAQTGQLVDKNDYVVNEVTTFQQQLSAQMRRQQPLALPAATQSLLNTTATPNSLTVVPVPYENPLLAGRSTVLLSSANPLYSPVGWQVAQPGTPAGFFPDSYSLLSSGKYLTRGNNVAAYDDYGTVPTTANPSVDGDAYSTTNAPDGTSSLTFDFPFDQTKGARDANNLAAGITNLFYWNNMLHDVMMAHGFDEVSGNFQYKNLTTNAQGVKLGKDNDFVHAEAQDGSGRNNANFSTPADGSSGRMQMYLFDNVAQNALTITAPSTIAGTYKFGNASFGASIPKLTATTAFTGNIVVINDGVSADGGVHSCAAPTNAAALVGNIALIQRGGCTAPASNSFSDKVKLAQNAGAVAAIIFDSDRNATTPLSPGGTDASITIPVIGISGADGARIQAALPGNALAAATIKAGPDFDGSFDNSVVSHEFGHGISNRLTGGGTATCLNNTTGYQTMGEGWSDFFGLWMTTRPGDVGSDKRYSGAYDVSIGPFGIPGFRHKPYTTDMSASGNSYTYAQVGPATTQFSETHDVGEIWTAVLWDLNWAMINKYGYNPDFFAATGGNNKALNLVLTGCKLQVCQPGFLDGRDAILRADSATNRAANATLIWTVFARRGMGYGAKQGARINGYPTVNNIAQAFDLPPQASAGPLSTNNGASAANVLEAYPNPAQDRLTVRTQVGSAAPIQVAVLDLLGKTVLTTKVPVAQMQQAGVELNTSRLATGLYVVRVSTTEGIFTTKVTIQR